MVELMKIMVTSFRRSHACTYTLSTPSRPPLTHASTGDSWTFLGKLGQSLVGSLIFCPGSCYTQSSVCALQESISQSCVHSSSFVEGLMATSSKRAYAITKSAARSPCPCGRPLLTCIFAGDTQTQFWLSLCRVSRSRYTQGLFEPSENLWRVRGLILNSISPLLPSCLWQTPPL